MVLTREWTVLCFDYQLRLLWENNVQQSVKVPGMAMCSRGLHDIVVHYGARVGAGAYPMRRVRTQKGMVRCGRE